MNVTRRIGAVLIGLTLTAGCSSGIERGIDRAHDLLYNKQYAEAERLFRKLRKQLQSVDDFEGEEAEQRLLIMDRLGKINALYLHDYPQAISDYRALVRRYPKTEEALAARAMVADIYQHKLGELETGIDEYQKLIAAFPDHTQTRWAHLQIVQAYFQLKNYQQARAEAETLIERWPTSAEAAQARFQIANSYYVQERYTEAVTTYQQLLDENADASLASLVAFELGNCHQELGDMQQALEYYYASLSEHPNPMLVQRKIKKVRQRGFKMRPAAGIYSPAPISRLARRHMKTLKPKAPATNVQEASTTTPVQPQTNETSVVTAMQPKKEPAPDTAPREQGEQSTSPSETPSAASPDETPASEGAPPSVKKKKEQAPAPTVNDTPHTTPSAPKAEQPATPKKAKPSPQAEDSGSTPATP